VSLADYKRYSIPLLDGPAFLTFLSTRKDFTPDEIARVGSKLTTGDGVSPWVHPAFGFVKGDVKDLPAFGFDLSRARGDAKGDSRELPDNARLDNQFVGAEIQVEARSAELAQKLAVALGDYVGDLVIRGRIVDFVGSNLNATRVALGRLDNDILQNNFLLAQQQQRLSDMRDISRHYPEASKENPRQVVSVDKTGARYLSPVSQLVGVESYIVEINETLRKLARDREKLQADLAFLTKARAEADKAQFGRQKLVLLEQALSEAFPNADSTKDAVRESFNSAKLNVDQIRYLSSDGLRFVSPPVVREPRYRDIAAFTAAGAVAGLLLATLIALVLAWSQTLKAGAGRA